ncbi:MAG TPA: HAMP domain-containing sensor histidine kinase [Thermomicrobiaceae bacterium]|nr:HAMP domain-containing sensor histidine kinase [Thermomicrobiaceae bacterium]
MSSARGLRRFSGVRWRLTFWYMAIQAAVLFIFSGVPYTRQLVSLRFTLLLTTPLILLLTAAGGYWLASRAIRPVQAIAQTARDISETDLSRRLNLPNRDELGELAATFDRMLDRLQAAFERQQRFIGDASHELRTPLTIVNLEVEHALANPNLTAEQARMLSIIQAESAYMTRLVNNLLILARADAGQAVFQRESLDLSDLVLEVIERLAPLAAKQGIELRVGELPELLLVGDRLYLSQMLSNIVENAIKYTRCFGGWVQVSAGNDPAGLLVAWVRVDDNGPGISLEHVPHLFERFYRVDQARATSQHGFDGADGSGLGLAIVDWIVKLHGGRISLRSEPGRGTTVEVRLPLEAVTMAEHPAAR